MMDIIGEAIILPEINHKPKFGTYNCIINMRRVWLIFSGVCHFRDFTWNSVSTWCPHDQGNFGRWDYS